MSKYRKSLPQLGSQLFLTDGGLETTLIFHNGMELPHFASFDLLRTAEGLKGRSVNTSSKDTKLPASADVIQLKSSSTMSSISTLKKKRPDTGDRRKRSKES